MDTILSLLSDENVNKIIVEKQNVINTSVTEAKKSIRLDLQICVEYANADNAHESITVEQYINNWLYNVKVNELKPTSFDRKEQTIKYQIIPYIGKLPINDLSSDDIQEMINGLKKDYSFSTIKKTYECINSCLKYAVKKRDLPYNVAESVIIPKNLEREKSDVKCFSEDELNRIEAEAVKCYKNGKRIYRMGEIVIFLADTGLRIGEALALEWKDINFKKKTVTVRKNMVFVKDRDDTEKAYKYIKFRVRPWKIRQYSYLRYP